MFAFENWHSALEMKLYFQRFIHHISGLPDFSALKFTRYNQYESLILPMKKYLEDYPDGAFAPNACYYLGRDSYQNKKYDEAMTLIDKALEATDASFAEDALAIKSEILMKQGKNAEAISTYRLLESKSSSAEWERIRFCFTRASKSSITAASFR